MSLQLPLFETPSNWLPPASFPDLSDAKEIAVDTENKDPGLKARGPGYIRKDGFVAGISVATDTGFKGYFPIAHEGGGNLDKNLVSLWLRETLRKKDRRYIFANAQYDMGWLRTIDIEVGGPALDISVAAALLDEEERTGYSLDSIARKYVGRGKNEKLLRDAAANWEVDAKADMWRLPAKYVGNYAQEDAVLTLQSWQAIKSLLDKEGLNDIWNLEQEVTPILFEMFWRGVRVNLNYAGQLNERWLKEENDMLSQLRMSADDIWTPQVLVAFCNQHKIEYPYTAPTDRFPRGQPSITADFMDNSGHKELEPLRRVRAINRTRKVFLCDVLIHGNIRGRIHPQYIQLASDDGGTRTGRLACRNPNAQQFPKRSTLFDAKALRKVMLPEEGKLWAKFDYWSQEPTLQVHYALKTGLPGAELMREEFKQKKKLYTIIEKATGGRCSYDAAKAVVLARSYGQQLKSMAAGLNISLDEGQKILDEFDQAAPYISMLASNLEAKAQATGFVRTVLGRVLRFKHWQPADRYLDRDERPLEWEQAKATWPKERLKRSFIHKALNKLIQGSAADQGKKALVEVNRALGLPMFPVHDELSKSVSNEAEALQMKEIVEQCVPLLCPAQADMELGVSWC